MIRTILVTMVASNFAYLLPNKTVSPGSPLAIMHTPSISPNPSRINSILEEVQTKSSSETYVWSTWTAAVCIGKREVPYVSSMARKIPASNLSLGEENEAASSNCKTTTTIWSSFWYSDQASVSATLFQPEPYTSFELYTRHNGHIVTYMQPGTMVASIHIPLAAHSIALGMIALSPELRQAFVRLMSSFCESNQEAREGYDNQTDSTENLLLRFDPFKFPCVPDNSAFVQWPLDVNGLIWQPRSLIYEPQTKYELGATKSSLRQAVAFQSFGYDLINKAIRSQVKIGSSRGPTMMIKAELALSLEESLLLESFSISTTGSQTPAPTLGPHPIQQISSTVNSSALAAVTSYLEMYFSESFPSPNSLCLQTATTGTAGETVDFCTCSNPSNTYSTIVSIFTTSINGTTTTSTDFCPYSTDPTHTTTSSSSSSTIISSPTLTTSSCMSALKGEF